MPYFKSSGLNLYYEEFGPSDAVPVIFLNGIMMNTLSWYEHKPFFKNYRTILFDFRDQGQSDKVDRQYTLDAHVADLSNLLNHLKIESVNIVGVSYGGHVAAMFAAQHSKMISSMILANTVARINNHTREMGRAWEEAAKLYNPDAFFTLSIPYIYSRTFYEHNLPWLKQRRELFRDLLTKEWFDAFIRLSTSAHDMDMTSILGRIECPTLLIGADQDIITPIPEMDLLHKNIKRSSFVVIKDAGHAAVLEKPKEFALATLGFIEVNRNIIVKDGAGVDR